MNYKKITTIIIGNDNIEECLNNIMAQSYIKDINIVLLYKKEKEDYIKTLDDKFSNINSVIIENDNILKTLEKNQKQIVGDYVSIINSEDKVTCDFYRTMVNKAEKEQADIIMSNCILEYPDAGRAYLNLSEASLIECENEEIAEEYNKKTELSFLWNIYSNKVFSKKLFQNAIEKISNENNPTKNDFLKMIFNYGKKLRIIENEVLFYYFEKSEEYLKDKNKFENSIINKVKTAWNDKLELLKKKIMSREIEIISFDIFDTLILRPFWSPIDLFSFMNDYFRKITETETGIDFSKIRVNSEMTARKKICIDSKIQDITLDEIYNQIGEETKNDKEVLDKLKKKEQELEIKFCYARKTAMEIYELAKYLDKKIVCISDMYLPIETIKKILSKNGYDIEKIYLSSEIKQTKFTGDLYKYVINDMNIDGNKIIHIGDNHYSDYEKALEQGIDAQLFAKPIDLFCDKNITNALGNVYKQNIPMWQNNSNGLNFMGIRCMLALVANKYFDNVYRTFNNQSDFNADPNLIGYYALGMFLYGVADWLLKATIKENYKKIVFFARDGYWTMKAYQILKQNYDNAPEEQYLYISRRALVPITLKTKFDFYKLSELIDIYKYTPKTILKFIDNIIYNTENLEKECNKIGIDINKKFENKSEFNVYMNLIIEKFYDKNKHEQLVKKLEQYFSNFFTDGACAFDIGYSAKAEMYLSKLCQKPIDTYFINISNEEAYEHMKLGNFKLHTFFDYRPAITGVVREYLMSTSDPSCIKYEIDENENIRPVFEKIENDYAKRFIFDVMQDKAMEFITDVVNIFKENIDELYYQKFYISLPHEMYINSPNVIDQEIFSNIDFEDAVGLGDNITAIDEWNREIKDKNQKRTKELFDNEYVEKIDEKCNENQSESESKSESESEVESESTYCSKRWKILEKLNKRFKNNNSK